MRRTPRLKYLLQLPAGYESQKRKRWPLLLFLHGMGERGSNLEVVKKNGPPKLIEEGQEFPFIVVSPQCPGNKYWNSATLAALVDALGAEYRVDEQRLYVTGISMGGFGVWALAQTYPDRWAAIAPICGGGQPAAAKRIAHLPVWAFHGAQDEVVPLAQSKRMVNALRRAGAKNIRLTVYPDAGHDSWTETYENPALYTWLLKQKRPKGVG